MSSIHLCLHICHQHDWRTYERLRCSPCTSSTHARLAEAPSITPHVGCHHWTSNETSWNIYLEHKICISNISQKVFMYLIQVKTVRIITEGNHQNVQLRIPIPITSLTLLSRCHIPIILLLMTLNLKLHISYSLVNALYNDRGQQNSVLPHKTNFFTYTIQSFSLHAISYLFSS